MSVFDNEKHTVIVVIMFMVTSNKTAIDVLIYFMSLTVAYHVSQNKYRIIEHPSHLHYTANKTFYQFLFHKLEKNPK